MKIGIFGGSFNPPHIMHKKLVEELIKEGYVDKVIFVPTGMKYEYKNNLISNEDRYNMIQLLIKDNNSLEVSDYEFTEEVTYTPNDEAIATVEKGVITALSKGSTDVVVSLEGANNSIFTVNVDLPTLKLSKPQSDLGIGDTDNVTVTLEDKDVTKDVTYTNENENIATVDKGNMQAQYQEGETTITVTVTGMNKTVTETHDIKVNIPNIVITANSSTKLNPLTFFLFFFI